MDLIKKLLEAKENGEVIKVIYHGGSQPGAVRAIFPLNVLDDKVVAKCLASNEQKTFFLDKLEICTDQNINPTYDPNIKMAISKYRNLNDIYNIHHRKLEAKGWIVKLEDNALRLYKLKKFKNGNNKLIEKVALIYQEIGTQSYFDGKKMISETVKYERPWLINGVRFKSIDKAVERFLEVTGLN